MSTTMPQIDASVVKKWKRYPAYKDSGVEWLGEVPEGWGIIPLKQATTHVSRGIGPDYVDESNIRVINQACIYWDGIRLENVKFQRGVDLTEIRKAVLQVGDLLINSTGTGTLGRAIVFDAPGQFIADSHLTIVRTIRDKLLPKYGFYLLQTPIYQGFIYASLISGSTNQIELSREGLRAMPLPIPSIYEQQAIADFLDRETAKIDALINKIREGIEKLKEYRTALISAAVTGKIDVRGEVS